MITVYTEFGYAKVDCIKYEKDLADLKQPESSSNSAPTTTDTEESKVVAKTVAKKDPIELSEEEVAYKKAMKKIIEVHFLWGAGNAIGFINVSQSSYLTSILIVFYKLKKPKNNSNRFLSIVSNIEIRYKI